MSSSDFVLKTFGNCFDEFSKTAISILRDRPEFKREALLFRYTTLKRFQEIIERQSLRATNIFNMEDDPNEFTCGSEHLLASYSEKIRATLKHYLKHDRAAPSCPHCLEHDQNALSYPAFVLCLSEMPDDMYMWEKYGDKHKGIRIGFTPEDILGFSQNYSSVETTYLVPIIYVDGFGRTEGVYAKAFEEMKTIFVGKMNGIENPDNECIQRIAYCTAVMSTFLKRREYSLEREWRIVSMPSGPYCDNVVGFFKNGAGVAQLEIKDKEIIDLLCNRVGHASKDILKIGAKAGEMEFVKYVIAILIKKQSGGNRFTDNISRSAMSIR